MTGAPSLWVMRREFGPHPAADLHDILPRWWTGDFNCHGEPEDAQVFARRIDAEAAYRTTHGQIDGRARAQRYGDALLEVGHELALVGGAVAAAPDKQRVHEHYEDLAAEAAALKQREDPWPASTSQPKALSSVSPEITC